MSGLSAVHDAELVRGLQERAARALPGDRVEMVGGWWLRHAPSCSWWAGTVLPHGEAGAEELARRIVRAEEFYAGYGMAARFQIAVPACPEELDGILAERGYRRHGPTSLQAAPIERVLLQNTTPSQAPGRDGGSLRVRLEERPTAAWFELWGAVHGGGSRGERELLGRIGGPCVYACAVDGGEVVAVGRAVVDTGWAGVFGMVTLPRARGRGAGRAVLRALAGWAGGCGADRMYLQVERGNAAALRLYERAGFGEVCGYHYRAAG